MKKKQKKQDISKVHLKNLTQGSPTYEPQPTTGPWPIGHRGPWVAATSVTASIAGAHGPCVSIHGSTHVSNGCSCACTHTCMHSHTHTHHKTIPSFPFGVANLKRLGNSDLTHIHILSPLVEYITIILVSHHLWNRPPKFLNY